MFKHTNKHLLYIYRYWKYFNWYEQLQVWIPRNNFDELKLTKCCWKQYVVKTSSHFLAGHTLRCDAELQDMNAKVRKNESKTTELEINQTRNFQKKSKALDIISALWSWHWSFQNYKRNSLSTFLHSMFQIVKVF